MRKIIINNEQLQILKESVKERLAAEREKVDTNPTDAQCKASNYKMGHISINGFEISIENPKGSYRRGRDKSGKQWKTYMHNDYGYFTKTMGKDGDAIDVFLGPYLDDKIEDAKIYPIDQYINGEFDETKVMMGFRSKEEAKKAYLSNYEKDWKGFKYITEVDIETFKKWLYDGHRQRKPFAKYATLTESVKSMVKDGVEKKLRDTVKKMVKDGSLPTDYSLEMAEWYYNIIAKALNIDRSDVFQAISKDDRYYFSIIDDEFEKCGGEYDLMDCENHRKGMKKDLEKLHNIKEDKLTEIVSKSIRKILKEGTHAKKINMNVELRKGGRNAVKMSEKQFEEVLKAAWEQYYIDAKPEKYYLINKWSIGNFVYKCCYKSPRNEKSKTLNTLYNDIWGTKYKFDTENVECCGGIKMSNKGVPYLTCYAGGDWECPVCFIVYFDGSKVRAYIPLKGNSINRNTHTAFGNSGEEDSDIKFIAKELNIDKEEAKKYITKIDYDEKSCVEDFLSRIDVKGTYKEKDYSKIHQEYDELVKRLKSEDEQKKSEKDEVKNDKGEIVPDKCNKCGGEVVLQIHGEPIYTCKKCGKYFGTMDFNKKNMNESFKSPKLHRMSKENGGLSVMNMNGQRSGNEAFKHGYTVPASEITDDMIGDTFTQEDPNYYKKLNNSVSFNNGVSAELKNTENLPYVKKPNYWERTEDNRGWSDMEDNDDFPEINNNQTPFSVGPRYTKVKGKYYQNTDMSRYGTNIEDTGRHVSIKENELREKIFEAISDALKNL